MPNAHRAKLRKYTRNLRQRCWRYIISIMVLEVWWKKFKIFTRHAQSRLTTEFHDSRYTPALVVESMTRVIASRSFGVTLESARKDAQPCAIIGPRSSSTTTPSAIISGVYDLAQLSYTATSPELNDAFKYPLFSRIVTSDDSAAKAAKKFLWEHSKTTHMAVLYVADPFGTEYNKALLQEASSDPVTKIEVRSFPLVFPPNLEDIQQALRKVKGTGYRHVFVIAFSSYLENLVLEAKALDLFGDDYFWMIGISTSFFGRAAYTQEVRRKRFIHLNKLIDGR